MIELGGNIKLDGFDNLEPAKLIVVKKIVGLYTKKISEKHSNFKEILVTLKTENPYEIEVILKTDKDSGKNVKGDNLFYVLDKVLSEVEKS